VSDAYSTAETGAINDNRLTVVAHHGRAEGEHNRTKVGLDSMEMWGGTRADPAHSRWSRNGSSRPLTPTAERPCGSIAGGRSARCSDLRVRGVPCEEFAYSAISGGGLRAAYGRRSGITRLRCPDDPERAFRPRSVLDGVENI
jgi:hypothetical protein